MIEKAVKDFHLKADLMFPKADVKLSAFIENIASMGGYTYKYYSKYERKTDLMTYDFYLYLLGTIFAVVIRPDNEAHRSVSVHVLRGCPKAEGKELINRYWYMFTIFSIFFQNTETCHYLLLTH
jgi:hypothetical protein